MPPTHSISRDSGLLAVLQARAVQPQWQGMVEKYLKRRTKALIANQLPRKIENVVFCPLSLAQLRAYRCGIRSVCCSAGQQCTSWPCHFAVQGAAVLAASQLPCCLVAAGHCSNALLFLAFVVGMFQV